MFEGEQDLGSWSINWEMKPNTFFVDHGAKEGDILRVYGRPTDDWWQIQFFEGHWGGKDVGLGNGNNVNPNIYNLSEGYVAVELDAARAALLTTAIDWGYAFILQGENFIVTKVSLVQFGATEKTVWEGSEYSGADYDRNLELGSEDAWVNAELPEGAEVRVYFTTDDSNEWQIQVFDGHWNPFKEFGLDGDNLNQFNATNAPNAVSKGYISFKAEGSIYTKLTTKAGWGSAIILQGKKVTFTRIAFI